MKYKFLLLSLLLPSIAFAEWTACGEDDNGDTANCEYKIENGTLTIRGTGNNGNIGYWDTNYAPWYGKNVQNVVIEDTIKDLGWFGFYGVKSQNALEIPSSVTTISENAFFGADIKEVIIPDSVSKIDTSAFNWSNLQKINIPSSVTYIAEAFRGTALTDIYIPDSVQYLGSATLSACKKLSSLTISDKTVLAQIFSNPDGSMNVDLANLKIYCTGDTSKCDANLAAAGYSDLKSERATAKKINGVTYVYDSKGKLITASGHRTEKRIYTIDEANRVAGTKNRVSIRYR